MYIDGVSGAGPVTTGSGLLARGSSKPSLSSIEQNYQVADEKMKDWSPKLWGSVGIGSVGGTQAMTPTEGKLLDNLTRDRGFVGLNTFKGIKEDAFATADKRSPPASVIPPAAKAQIAAIPNAREQQIATKQWPANDGHNDAFRHAYWNARLTKEFGETWTKQFTTAHEGNNPGTSTREAMDLYNNEVGRQIARDHPNASNAELADHVKQALDDGKLVVIDRSGHLAWSNTVAVGDHGISIKLGVPNQIATPDGAASAR
jgi:hypothetical protein